MKVVIAAVTGVFVIYAVWQSYLIASTGVTYQIPQLEGDGGGGLIFAGLCLIAGIAVLLRPLLSSIVYLLAALLMSFVAIAFQDHIEFLWTIIALALSTLAFFAQRRSRGRLRQKERKAGSNKAVLHR